MIIQDIQIDFSEDDLIYAEQATPKQTKVNTMRQQQNDHKKQLDKVLKELHKLITEAYGTEAAVIAKEAYDRLWAIHYK